MINMDTLNQLAADNPEPPQLQEYLRRHTLSGAVEKARQQYQINPVAPFQHPERVPLTTRVFLCNGVGAVICGHSTCDYTRYEVCYFNRHFWHMERRWVSRGAFEVLETKTLTSERISVSVQQ